MFGLESKFDLLDRNLVIKGHPDIKSPSEHFEKISKEINTMIEETKNSLQLEVMKRNEKENKTRIERRYKYGDIVFALDKTIPKSSDPSTHKTIRLKFKNTPMIVLHELYTTVLCKRVSDGQIFLYHKDLLKKYDPKNALFLDIPLNLRKIIAKEFENFTENDIQTIREIDQFPIMDNAINLAKEGLSIEDNNDPNLEEDHIENIDNISLEDQEGYEDDILRNNAEDMIYRDFEEPYITEEIKDIDNREPQPISISSKDDNENKISGIFDTERAENLIDNNKSEKRVTFADYDEILDPNDISQDISLVQSPKKSQ